MSLEINANNVILNENPSAKSLISILEKNDKKLGISDAILYYDLQFSIDFDGTPQRFDIIISSKNYGIIIFNCMDISKRTLKAEHITELITEYQQNYSALFSKLLKNSNLRKGPTKLKIDVHPLFYFFSQDDLKKDEFNSFIEGWEDLEVILNLNDISSYLESKKQSEPFTDLIYNEIRAMLEGSKGILNRSSRPKKNLDSKSKGRILDRIQSEITLFDADQKRAALQIIDGPQRIRGLAGSGKTIVLAMKAAQIHASSPDSKILYTYWTKQLHDYIKHLITKFYRQLSEKDPNWDKIDIIHAWGGKSLRGVYYDTCKMNGIEPKTLGDVMRYKNKAFKVACQYLEKYKLKQVYDYSLLDEGQNFPIYFYRLCRKITKNNRVIWGYDECQNILDMEIQDTIKTFGKDVNGNPFIDFSQKKIPDQDKVLYMCYRNPLSVLVTGFALGLGIYNDNILQLPENKELWEDWGFNIENGSYRTNDQMVIVRPDKYSPLIKNELLENGRFPIRHRIFDIEVETVKKIPIENECDYIAECIIKDLAEDLLPQDIMIISLDDFAAKKYFEILSEKLSQNNIDVFNATKIPYGSTQFIQENRVTLTTVYRAQGNEAGSVYILGIDRIFQNKDSIIERNKLFTAITRTNAWVTMTASGPNAQIFNDEIEKILQNKYKLVFKMPDISKMKKFRRDLAHRHAKYQEVNRIIESYSKEIGIDKDQFIEELMKRQVKK